MAGAKERGQGGSILSGEQTTQNLTDHRSRKVNRAAAHGTRKSDREDACDDSEVVGRDEADYTGVRVSTCKLQNVFKLQICYTPCLLPRFEQFEIKTVHVLPFVIGRRRPLRT